MFIAGVMQRSSDVGDWKSFFRRELAEWGVVLGEDGVFSYNGSNLGTYEFLSAEEARRRFAPAEWLEASSGCPFVGRALGFFAWQFWFTDGLDWFSAIQGEENRSISIPALKEGRGIIARVDDERFASSFRHSVHLKRLSLGEAVGKYSLDDGAELLSRDEPEYVQAVQDEVSRVLRADGWDELIIFWRSTHHNPLQWFSSGDDVPMPSDEEAEALMVELWLYDFAVLDSGMFQGVHF